MTTLFSVDGSTATPAAVQSMTGLGLHERAHLQEWVLANPAVLGDEVMVITSEYDRWTGADGTRAKDRLDVLGLDASGRLVVAELKRADSGGDVHLQAITYAALVSRFTLETLAEALAHYRTRRGEPTTVVEATNLIREHAGGDLDPDLLRRPRLVLMAGGFPRQVTHTAVWLSEVGVDIDLVEVTAWSVGGQTLAGFTKVYPTPEVEEFTLAPARAESAQTAKKAEERGRAATAVKRLVQASTLADGAPLRLRPSHGTNPETRAAIDEWVTESPRRGEAIWRNDPVSPIVWAADGKAWTPTALARHILAAAAGVDAPVRGPAWWVTQDGTDLATLAGGIPAGRRDWTDLHDILEALPRGRWTTYGDLASVIGTAAQPLGQHVTRCPQCATAYRILSSDGRPAANFTWGDPQRTDTVEDVLSAEGVTFSNGAAAPAQRLSVEELRGLIPG